MHRRPEQLLVGVESGLPRGDGLRRPLGHRDRALRARLPALPPHEERLRLRDLRHHAISVR